ncbi:hypothetical protein EDD21DRAFT_91983 [Dissophora ornata]|nr:hypothetical protein EDD21DRAFT_91983 [Dissophora ornata]
MVAPETFPHHLRSCLSLLSPTRRRAHTLLLLTPLHTQRPHSVIHSNGLVFDTIAIAIKCARQGRMTAQQRIGLSMVSLFKDGADIDSDATNTELLDMILDVPSEQDANSERSEGSALSCAEETVQYPIQQINHQRNRKSSCHWCLPKRERPVSRMHSQELCSLARRRPSLQCRCFGVLPFSGRLMRCFFVH